MHLTAAEQTKFFATCAGRMFALTEHYWLISSPKSEHTEREYTLFSEMLDATVHNGAARDVLRQRVQARMDLRRLLSAIAFQAKGDQKIWLEARATQMIEECRSMLLS